MAKRRAANKPITSLQELRPLHVDLLTNWAKLDGPERLKRGEELRRTAAAAGAYIKNPVERDGTQGVIDYWTATLSSLPECTEYPQLLTLAEFDPKTVQGLSKDCPFPGLNPFRIQDADNFHGREQATKAALDAIVSGRVLIVTGPSGLGKSSLVRAGVSAAMADNPSWSVLPVLIPGRDPLATLLRTVRPRDAERDWLDQQRAALRKAPETFRKLAEEASKPEQGILLIVDRAEELLTMDAATADIALVASALSQLVGSSTPARHRLIIVVREDYLDQLRAVMKTAGEEIPDEAVFRPDPPTRAELEQMVVRPAEATGLKFDPAVVEDMVTDCAEVADALPLLQYTLNRLWDQAEVDRIGWADYEAVGEPCQIVQRIAEQAYSTLEAREAQEAARLVFLALLGPGANPARDRLRRDDLRQAVKSSGLEASQFDGVLDAFERRGLLRRWSGDDAGDDRFEIAHDAVFRHWPRLVLWLQERRRNEEVNERLNAAIERWRTGGRGLRYLLTGPALEEALAHKGTSRALDELISASRRVRFAKQAIAATIALFLLGAVSWSWIKRSGALEQLVSFQNKAESSAKDKSELTDRFGRQALLSDQTLLRLVTSGKVRPGDIPPSFLARAELAPGRLGTLKKGYDETFLQSDKDSDFRVPLPKVRGRPVQVLNYPHMTLIYDTQRRIPLVAATNFDREAESLPPFPGIGFFPDPRVSGAVQHPLRTSHTPQYGLVPIVGYPEVAWKGRRMQAKDDSFLHFSPLAVLQPWSFYQEAWANIETQLLNINADRISFFTGPILRRNDPVVDGLIVPQSFFKIAVYEDADSGERNVEAYLIDLRASDKAAATRFLTTLAALKAATGIDFSYLESAEPQPAIVPGSTTPGKPEVIPPVAPPVEDAPRTVYLEFAVMPREDAVEISRALAELGYVMPGEERIDAADGKHEVRYAHAADKEAAEALARDTEEVLSQMGFEKVEIQVRQLTGLKRLPPPGVLELWIGVARPVPEAAAF